MDIHNYKRQFERNLERIQESKEISKENKKVIIDFKDYLLSEGIGIARINRFFYELMKYNRMFKKPFTEASKEDIRAVVAEVEQTDLSAETKKCSKIVLKKLYKFIKGIDEEGKYPKEVEWIKTRIPENHRKLPEELLTEKEIMSIIQKCDKLRDKALISSLAESGCRISEIALMKIKHVSFEEYGARLTVNGKTGMRKILIINSSPYLQEWINQHPNNSDPEAYLWYNPYGELLSYTRISCILKNAAKRAEIKKRVYPHLLRHSRATFLANNMSDAALKHYFGWAQASKMAATYIHMSGKDTDRAILEVSGIEIKKEKQKSIMRPKKCLKCRTVNEATNKFCKICGLPLDKEETERIIKTETDRSIADGIMDQIVKDPEILELIKKKINQ